MISTFARIATQVNGGDASDADEDIFGDDSEPEDPSETDRTFAKNVAPAQPITRDILAKIRQSANEHVVLWDEAGPNGLVGAIFSAENRVANTLNGCFRDQIMRTGYAIATSVDRDILLPTHARESRQGLL